MRAVVAIVTENCEPQMKRGFVQARTYAGRLFMQMSYVALGGLWWPLLFGGHATCCRWRGTVTWTFRSLDSFKLSNFSGKNLIFLGVQACEGKKLFVRLE